MLGSNTIAMAKDIEDIPVSIISIPSYKKEDIKDIKEGTVVVHKDGSITNLTLNKDLKNVPIVENLENGDKRVAITVGMQKETNGTKEETPVTFAVSGTKEEAEMRQTVKNYETKIERMRILLITTLVFAIIILVLTIAGAFDGLIEKHAEKSVSKKLGFK
jgi:hypothetical protein